MNKRILIAEDEEDMRKILSLHLNSKGYEVLEAKDGIEAVDRAKQQYRFNFAGYHDAGNGWFASVQENS
ncbi:CheY-like chemotaxis protein [Peribacillus simplex]|uniref:response regulator n=1 Tax=Peribacillus simplex TaxID=1478 RepID=UPI0024E1DD34|nr:hypothetical protein [Peribacillus simplex]MDF9763769.1 CheY-like chemotaxis protein [Peribacillus simplex]